MPLEDFYHAGLSAVAQGRAATSTRPLAAYHEAGHCLLHYCAGHRVEAVRVALETGEWRGWTEVRGCWSVSLGSPVGDDIQRACIIFAGFAAELLTEPRGAVGSSLDELSEAIQIARVVAHKTQTEPRTVQANIYQQTMGALIAERNKLDTVAAALLAERKIKGAKLRRLLR